MPDPEEFTAQLGRISGKLLAANLIRNGVDLTFRNKLNDDDLLYLQVETSRIGINTETPILPDNEFGIDVNDSILSTNLISDQATIDNIIFEPTARITTVTGEINIRPSSPNPTAIFDRLQAGNVAFNDNFIENVGENQNLILDPDGLGTAELLADTNVTGSLSSTGNIILDGNLSTTENLVIGDNREEDILTIFPRFQNNLKPSLNIEYDIGSTDYRWKDLYTDNFNVSSSVQAGNVLFSDPSTISSTAGGLNFNLSGSNRSMIFTSGLSTPDLLIIDNKITTNVDTDLLLEASGTGKVSFNNPTNFSNDLTVSGWVNMTGSLSTTSNIILGNEPTDVVVVNTELDQDINPGTSLAFNLGRADRRWRAAYIEDWTTITNIKPQGAVINSLMQLGGNNNVRALSGNDDIILNSATDIYRIEDVEFQDNNITNLLDTPLTLRTTGIGYYRFAGDNGIVLPVGTTAQRPVSPEVGDTRWNTSLGYVECFDGNVYVVSIGPGDQLTQADAEELNTVYSLILG